MSMLQIEKRLQGWLWEAFRRTVTRKAASLDAVTDQWLSEKLPEVEKVVRELAQEERAADQISFRLSEFIRDGDELHLWAVINTSEGQKLIGITPKTAEAAFKNKFGEAEVR